MKGYMASQNYIVKEILRSGVGVPIAFDEQVAIEDTYKAKNLDSSKMWYEISIPEKELYLDMDSSIKNQNKTVQNLLNSANLIMPLFITDAKKILMDKDINNLNPEEERILSKELENFRKDKFESIIQPLNSGYELLDFINSKCVTHNLAISTALLYSCGIMGSLYSDSKGERALIFNAHDDITINKFLPM